MNISVIQAGKLQFTDLWELHQQMLYFSIEVEGGLQRGTLEDEHDRVYGWLSDPLNTRVWIAYSGERPVGYLHMCRGTYLGINGDGLRIEGFYIEPAYRCITTIRSLWRPASEFVDGFSVDVQASVLMTNRTAHKMVRRRGFRPIAIVYQKEIRHVERTPRTGGRQKDDEAGQQHLLRPQRAVAGGSDVPAAREPDSWTGSLAFHAHPRVSVGHESNSLSAGA